MRRRVGRPRRPFRMRKVSLNGQRLGAEDFVTIHTGFVLVAFVRSVQRSIHRVGGVTHQSWHDVRVRVHGHRDPAVAKRLHDYSRGNMLG